MALDLVDYLSSLGISHCYASPFWRAKSGSLHGYDIIDHTSLNPEIGTLEEFIQWVESLHQLDMGLIVDVVPNHMYIANQTNWWWNNILENGPASPYADYFDIDWHPLRAEMENKILLPFLDQLYREALENQTLQVIYDEGCFYLKIPSVILPTDPKSWNLILELILKALQTMTTTITPHLVELESVIASISNLPSTNEIKKERVEERQRDKEVIKQRIAKLVFQNADIRHLFSQQLDVINGKKGDSKSFDLLETFLNLQSYRPCFWRVANDEINYLRFFDISDFAGIRAENPEVFHSIHTLVFKFIQKGFVDGIRIDHIDGLWDPEQYLKDLQSLCKRACENWQSNEQMIIFVEKILIGNEKLPSEWPVAGTVGYDFLNQVNGLFVYQPNKQLIEKVYCNFTGLNTMPYELVYKCKKLILLVAMSSELHMLAKLLDTIAAQHRNSRDFTAESLRSALRIIIASFTVYRTYINAFQHIVHEDDKRYILSAIAQAKHRNPAISESLFDFIRDILLLEHPPELDEEQKIERENFVMHFQQLTGPVMAKGLEDTAFYRYFPLSSLSEVGADIFSFGMNRTTFHQKNQARAEHWPNTLLSTSTHDTKRGEDVRARINVLSEIPESWDEVLNRWYAMNRKLKIKSEDELIPDENEEYLLYQTLIGSWPPCLMDAAGLADYRKRMQRYMIKAVKEAKIHTSWINPNKNYEDAIEQFIQSILNFDSNNPFIVDFQTFIPKIITAGMLNSLSQVLIKATSPGIPDFYQGNEIWDFSLVDPDNRGLVDFEKRKQLLRSILDGKEAEHGDMLKQLLQHPEDGRIKLLVTAYALHARKRLPALFEKGSYLPLTVAGEKQNHLIAYAREEGKKTVIVMASRFFTSLVTHQGMIIDPAIWRGTQVDFPVDWNGKRFRDIFTKMEISIDNNRDGQPCIDVERMLGPLSVALLESID